MSLYRIHRHSLNYDNFDIIYLSYKFLCYNVLTISGKKPNLKKKMILSYWLKFTFYVFVKIWSFRMYALIPLHSFLSLNANCHENLWMYFVVIPRCFFHGCNCVYCILLTAIYSELDTTDYLAFTLRYTKNVLCRLSYLISRFKSSSKRHSSEITNI